MARILVVGVVFAGAVGGLVRADDQALKELAGAYAVEALSKGGEAAPAGLLEGATATIGKDELTITTRGKEKRAKLTADPARTPPHLDLAPADGPEKGRTFPGIYKRDGGGLWIAFAEAAGADRPPDFSGKGGATVLKLKRAAGK